MVGWGTRHARYNDGMGRAVAAHENTSLIAMWCALRASTSTDYPNKFYSLATSTQSGTGTSTAYIWHADTLVATVEQRLVNGVASGTPATDLRASTAASPAGARVAPIEGTWRCSVGCMC